MTETSQPRPAGLLRQFGSMVYDALLVFAIWAMTMLILVIIGNRAPSGPLIQTLLFIELYAFFVYFWTRRGQTVGMLAWHLHIESTDGRPITPMQATVRFFTAMVALGAAGIGYLWMYLDPGRRTWPDLMSDTRIMHTPSRRRRSRKASS